MSELRAYIRANPGPFVAEQDKLARKMSAALRQFERQQFPDYVRKMKRRYGLP